MHNERPQKNAITIKGKTWTKNEAVGFSKFVGRSEVMCSMLKGWGQRVYADCQVIWEEEVEYLSKILVSARKVS